MNKILSSSVIALSLAMASVHLYANDKVVQRDTSKVTHIQEIRNATIKVTYAVMCAEKTGGFNLVNYRHSSGVYHEQETEDLHRRI
ncbi:hypothetical protein P3S51_13300 (plasmid) [Acinetobacter sp. ANC 7201]|nr:hypothetical protein P3S51_13300 [Acinetobacter sp. ANC 7201]